MAATGTTTAYLGLGSNLGDRLAHLRAAAGALAAWPGVRVAAASPIFETDAVAAEPQPPYLNAAVRVETSLSARALLDACLGVEQALGRERPPGREKAPRTIDVDLLLFGTEVIAEPELTVPHPALLGRAFVRVPLATVAEAGLRHPVAGEPLDRAAPSPAVRPFPGRLL